MAMTNTYLDWSSYLMKKTEPIHIFKLGNKEHGLHIYNVIMFTNQDYKGFITIHVTNGLFHFPFISSRWHNEI